MSDVFCRYIEYKAYMDRLHPGCARLSYRD